MIPEGSVQPPLLKGNCSLKFQGCFLATNLFFKGISYKKYKKKYKCINWYNFLNLNSNHSLPKDMGGVEGEDNQWFGNISLS